MFLPVLFLPLEYALPAAETPVTCFLLGGLTGSSAHCPPEAFCLFTSNW